MPRLGADGQGRQGRSKVQKLSVVSRIALTKNKMPLGSSIVID